MLANTRFTSLPRSALFALAVLFAACNDEPDTDAVPAQPTPPPPSSPTKDDELGADKEMSDEAEPARRAERMPQSPPLQPHGTQTPPDDTFDGQQQRSGISGPQTAQQMEIVEKSASGDIRGFERRLRQELEKEEMHLAAAIDLQQQPQMRLLVVAPKPNAKTGAGRDETAMKDDARTDARADRGAPEMETPGTPQTPKDVSPQEPTLGETPTPSGTPTPKPDQTAQAMEDGEDGMPSTEARTALEQVRVIVAYTEEGDTERVRLAYFEHPAATGDPTRGEDMTATVDSAIDRAARGLEGAPAG
jgi:hypothetical protein